MVDKHNVVSSKTDYPRYSYNKQKEFIANYPYFIGEFLASAVSAPKPAVVFHEENIESERKKLVRNMITVHKKLEGC